jgi:hypothetical protein
MGLEMTEFIFLSALSFLFGVTQKLADGHHEHGLNFFPGAGVVFGAVAGGIAFSLIGYSPVLQAAYLGPLLYWFYKQKIDCLPLTVLALMMLFGVFLSKGAFAFPFNSVLGVFAGYVVLDVIKQHSHSPLLKRLFAKRLHFHLIRFVYAMGVWDVYGYSSLFFDLLGIAFANRWFTIPREAESDRKNLYQQVK